MDPIEFQRRYYESSAASYDDQHIQLEEIGEHEVALHQLLGYIKLYGFGSLLDVGSGTGRVLDFVGRHADAVTAVGIEPVAELRTIGHQRGIAAASLIEGDATRLDFPDGAFDVVTAFGMLHHVPDPGKVIAEMLRVARHAIFISDGNAFGQGSPLARLVKYGFYKLSLWRALQFVVTRGKMYKISEGDGLFYSYSPFLNIAAINGWSKTIIISSTRGKASNLIGDAETVSLLALKDK